MAERMKRNNPVYDWSVDGNGINEERYSEEEMLWQEHI